MTATIEQRVEMVPWHEAHATAPPPLAVFGDSCHWAGEVMPRSPAARTAGELKTSIDNQLDHPPGRHLFLFIIPARGRTSSATTEVRMFKRCHVKRRTVLSRRVANRLSAAAICATGLSLAARASAATESFQFLNSQGGADPWSDVASWSPDHRLPQAGDDAVLVVPAGQAVATRTVLYDLTDGAGVTLHSVTLDGLPADSPVILKQPGGALSSQLEYVGMNGAAIYQQLGGSNTSGQLSVGGNSGSIGRYELADGVLTAPILYVGNSGTATFVQNGGSVTASTVFLGASKGSQGQYLMGGGTLTLTNGNLIVGAQGSGSFVQSGSSSVTSPNLMDIASTGSYEVQSGSLSARSVDVSGSLTQSGGTITVSGTSFPVGLTAKAGATITLAGGSLSTPSLTVDSGSALHQSAGSTLTVPASPSSLAGVQIGGTADLNGTATFATATIMVSGSNGSLTMARPLIPGSPAAPFSMMIRNGATVNLPAGLSIGGAGAADHGSLNVDSGGSLSAGNVSFDSVPGSFTSASVGSSLNGSGSVVQTAASTLDLASGGGHATLDIETGGTYRTGTGRTTIGSGGTITVRGGSFVGNGPTQNDGTIEADNGTATLMELTGAGKVVVGGGIATAAPPVLSVQSFDQASVRIRLGATLRVSPPGAAIGSNRTESLTLDPGTSQGILDLGHSDLTVHYGNGASPDANVRQWLTTGYNGGAWTGTGIISSVAPSSGHTLGYADGADGVVNGLAAGDELIKYTMPGDVNLDGRVNFDDLLALAQHYGSTGAKWDQGDSDYDGTVGFDDLLMLAQHYGPAPGPSELSALAAPFSADVERAFASVPEPSSLALLCLGRLWLRRRRTA